ncbi:MAG TPA: hypothetical protein VFB99_21005 [Vicinamibacterales bacterium]|nr:hypothetical protein [Vicinamibacterales bacterium]
MSIDPTRIRRALDWAIVAADSIPDARIARENDRQKHALEVPLFRGMKLHGASEQEWALVLDALNEVGASIVHLVFPCGYLIRRVRLHLDKHPLIFDGAPVEPPPPSLVELEDRYVPLGC